MPTLAVGSSFSYNTPAARYRGTVVALGGGFLIGTAGLVTTERSTGSEVDKVGPLSTEPIVLPVASVTALT